MKDSNKTVLSMAVLQLHDIRKNTTNGLPVDIQMLDAICSSIENVLKIENELDKVIKKDFI